MAHDSRVYRVLIASPSDVEEERQIAAGVIQEWNDLHSSSRKVVLLPLRWETHTAPEYGTRPQEVINRSIVDECDLLIGIFWTRIGAPTGAAESGTIEEIDRAGKAGKPIMLYFSRVEVDPDRIDVSQIERLKKFKEQSYPMGLVETYKRLIDFRDKLAKQLELKVRDLQRIDTFGKPPLTLQFLSADDGANLGTWITRPLDHLKLENLDPVPQDKRHTVEQFAGELIKERCSCPVALALANSGALGVRNLYVELNLNSEPSGLELRDTPFRMRRRWSSYLVLSPRYLGHDEQDNSESELPFHDQSAVSVLRRDGFQRVAEGWAHSFEWEALQPKRVRLIKPMLHLYAPQSAVLSVSAKVFADTFPEPLALDASITLEVSQRSIKLNDLLPNWEKLLNVKGGVIERFAGQ